MSGDSIMAARELARRMEQGSLRQLRLEDRRQFIIKDNVGTTELNNCMCLIGEFENYYVTKMLQHLGHMMYVQKSGADKICHG